MTSQEILEFFRSVEQTQLAKQMTGREYIANGRPVPEEAMRQIDLWTG